MSEVVFKAYYSWVHSQIIYRMYLYKLTLSGYHVAEWESVRAWVWVRASEAEIRLWVCVCVRGTERKRERRKKERWLYLILAMVLSNNNNVGKGRRGRKTLLLELWWTSPLNLSYKHSKRFFSTGGNHSKEVEVGNKHWLFMKREKLTEKNYNNEAKLLTGETLGGTTGIV